MWIKTSLFVRITFRRTFPIPRWSRCSGTHQTSLSRKNSILTSSILMQLRPLFWVFSTISLCWGLLSSFLPSLFLWWVVAMYELCEAYLYNHFCVFIIFSWEYSHCINLRFWVLFCLWQKEKAEVIQTSLFVAGLNTLLQTLFGTRLPVVIGSSYAFIASALYIVLSDRYATYIDPQQVRLASQSTQSPFPRFLNLMFISVI